MSRCSKPINNCTKQCLIKRCSAVTRRALKTTARNTGCGVSARRSSASFTWPRTALQQVLERGVGPHFGGYLSLDYFSANRSFVWDFIIKAQSCWAHLIGDIRFLETHPHRPTRDWAQRLLAHSRRLFKAWHRREQMSERGRARSFQTHRDNCVGEVRHTPDSPEARNLAARFAGVAYTDDDSQQVLHYDRSQDYFRFLCCQGLEPTNNHSEQQIRHCVIDRLITQGTRSEAGQHYHERIWTVIATCRKQGRRVYQFLCDSIEAKLNNLQAPSLIPP